MNLFLIHGEFIILHSIANMFFMNYFWVPRSWVIPVLPGGELEVLLEAAIDLCNRGVDTQSEHCQRFFREGLTVSFTKIMTDEAVSSWRCGLLFLK